MGRTILHLLRFNRQFATGVALLAVVAIFACLSFFSPYPPNDSFVVPPDLPPSWDYPMGTTSRGQDLFWLLSFAIRNTLLFGIVVAVLSRILALVIGLFLGGVWLFRNWQRVSQRGRGPKLNVLETRSLGGRHTLHVIGYEQERFLIAASPGGVNLVSHLPVAGEAELPATTKTSPTPSFAQALTQVLKGK
jgi:flagellar biogenesis protein FliO